MDLRVKKQRTAQNAVTAESVATTLAAQKAGDERLAAFKAQQRNTITNRTHVLQFSPDHELFERSGGLDGSDAQHPWRPASNSAGSTNPTASSSSAQTPLSNGEYITKQQQKHINWTRNVHMQRSIGDSLFKSWQSESVHDRLDAHSRIERLKDLYAAQPVHTCNGILCSGQCSVTSYREVWYRTWEHGCFIQVPWFKCHTCTRGFEMPPGAVRWEHSMHLVVGFCMSGLTCISGTAYCKDGFRTQPCLTIMNS